MEKHTPTSFGRERYFGVNAFKLISAAGTETFVRYRIEPDAGVEWLDDEALGQMSDDFLYKGVPKVLESGPVVFTLRAQIAGDGDITDDNTYKWPSKRKIVDLGKITLTSIVDDQSAQQKRIIFDPIPRVEGIEPSRDPLLEVRAGVYLISGRERRAA